MDEVRVNFKQCCGAGAGGAEIILGPGAGAKIICLINIFCTKANLELTEENKIP